MKAAFEIAGKGIGGLIVLQRENDLDEFIHGETLIDAELNEDMLVSIFNPQSPLHDGAVIISRDRIRYSTALLPVSQSSSFPKEWGTRHRAGLGITEVSDAECIIISEERKEVLLASRGRVEKKEASEDLTRSLSGFPSLRGEKEGEKRWPGKIFNDLSVKALFLFLVCFLWILFVGLRQGEISFDTPIEYYSMPSDLVMNGEPPKEINVRLRGSQRLLTALTPDRLRVRIDLSEAHLGINQISLSETDINVPSGITVTNFYPQKIRLQVSQTSTPNRKLPRHP